MEASAQRTYRWLFWCVALIGLSLDQVSKYGVFYALYNEGIGTRDMGGKRELIPGVFGLSAEFTGKKDPGNQPLSSLRTWGGEMLPQVNHGALFGLGGEKAYANFFFALVSLTAAVVIVWWASRLAGARDGFLCLALGLILAGTLGNLYDRVVFGGVRDFLYWYYLVNWPVFNVADCGLVCGAGLLLFQAFFLPPAADPSSPQAAEEKLGNPSRVAEVK